MKIVRAFESTAETQPQLQPALLRLSGDCFIVDARYAPKRLNLKGNVALVGKEEMVSSILAAAAKHYTKV